MINSINNTNNIVVQDYQLNYMELQMYCDKLSQFINYKMPHIFNMVINKNISALNEPLSIKGDELKEFLLKYQQDFAFNDDGSFKTNENGFPVVEGEKKEEYDKGLKDIVETKNSISFFCLRENVFYYDSNNYTPLSPNETYTLVSIIGVETNNNNNSNKQKQTKINAKAIVNNYERM